MIASSLKLVEVNLKLDVTAEDADEDSNELLDNAWLDDDLLEELDELGVLLDDKLEELGVSVAALELCFPEEPPPQAASNKNDKYKIALTNFMAITCCCY